MTDELQFDDPEQDEGTEAKAPFNAIATGLTLIAIGSVSGLFSIGWPIYQAYKQTADTVYLYHKLIALSIILPMVGIAMLIFKEKIFNWIPTEPDQKITGKHILYLIGSLVIFFVIYHFLNTYLESLGYVDENF